MQRDDKKLGNDKKLDGKTIVVFGGSGFIGRHLMLPLARHGATIRIASRKPHAIKEGRTAGVVGQIVPVFCDINDTASIEKAVNGADAVVNLVGILAENHAGDFQKIHVDFPARLAKIASAAGVSQFVQVSALAADAQSASVYAQSKAAGEAAVQAAFPAATVLRPSLVFGAEDRFFNFFAGLARFSPVLPLIGGGQTKFQPVYVADVAAAIVACLNNDTAVGKIYALGGSTVYDFRQLLTYMLEQTGQKRHLQNVPWKIAELQGRVLEKLPIKLLTRDQVALLHTDSVVPEGALTLADLGIPATPMEVIVPTYLWRFRAGGKFAGSANSRNDAQKQDAA